MGCQLSTLERSSSFRRPMLRPQRTRVQESEQRREQVSITTLGGHPISLKLTVITTTKSLIRTLQTPGTPNLQIGVIAWSLGKDKAGATAAASGDKKTGTYNDDVISWQ